MKPDPLHLTLYSRESCHLCEDMREALEAYQTELGFTFAVYDIDEDEDLLARFNALVPLVYADEVEIMRYYFELETLKNVIDKAAGS